MERPVTQVELLDAIARAGGTAAGYAQLAVVTGYHNCEKGGREAEAFFKEFGERLERLGTREQALAGFAEQFLRSIDADGDMRISVDRQALRAMALDALGRKR